MNQNTLKYSLVVSMIFRHAFMKFKRLIPWKSVWIWKSESINKNKPVWGLQTQGQRTIQA
jgi:hypothetical protein